MKHYGTKEGYTFLHRKEKNGALKNYGTKEAFAASYRKRRLQN